MNEATIKIFQFHVLKSLEFAFRIYFFILKQQRHFVTKTLWLDRSNFAAHIKIFFFFSLNTKVQILDVD